MLIYRQTRVCMISFDLLVTLSLLATCVLVLLVINYAMIKFFLTNYKYEQCYQWRVACLLSQIAYGS